MPRLLRQRPTYPPLPVGMAFIDRVTGQRWLLTSVGDQAAIEEIDDPWPGYEFRSHSEVDFPGPNGPIRLSVEAGRLVAREIDTPARSFPPVLTRPRGQSQDRIFRIVAELVEAPPDAPKEVIILGAGALAVTGQPLEVIFDEIVPLGLGAMALLGRDVRVIDDNAYEVDPGVLTLGGQPLLVNAREVIEIEAGELALAGTETTVNLGEAVALGVGSIALAGLDPDIKADEAVVVGTGAIALTGQTVDAGQLWILETGEWDDGGVWDDAAEWNDG